MAGRKAGNKIVQGRRAFLAGGAALGFTAAATARGGTTANNYGDDAPRPPGETGPPASGTAGFLTPAERTFIDAAVARLIPADELGGGAFEAGCTEFIDRQLSGPYGRAEDLYMQGPWADGTPSQGFQSRQTPAQCYRSAIAAIGQYSRSTYAGREFSELTPSQQDAVLGSLEHGEIELSGVDAKAFFAMVLQNTIEGFWSDPIYGGNRNFVGWNLIGFPGARYDYRDHLDKPGERYPLPPVGLKGRPGWSDDKVR